MQSQSRPPAEATWSDLPRENAQVQDIALYKRERAVHQGSLIAVNASWTCYAIRGGMVRVIHRETEEKALLRGHALEVVDLKFLPGQDVIATVANDGNVYVWRLSCVGSEIKCVPRPISTAHPPHPPTAPPPHPPWLPHPPSAPHLGYSPEP